MPAFALLALFAALALPLSMSAAPAMAGQDATLSLADHDGAYDRHHDFDDDDRYDRWSRADDDDDDDDRYGRDDDDFDDDDDDDGVRAYHDGGFGERS